MEKHERRWIGQQWMKLINDLTIHLIKTRTRLFSNRFQLSIYCGAHFLHIIRHTQDVSLKSWIDLFQLWNDVKPQYITLHIIHEICTICHVILSLRRQIIQDLKPVDAKQWPNN